MISLHFPPSKDPLLIQWPAYLLLMISHENMILESAFQDVLAKVAALHCNALLGSPSWEYGVRLLSWELLSSSELVINCRVLRWTHIDNPFTTIVFAISVLTYCSVLSLVFLSCCLKVSIFVWHIDDQRSWSLAEKVIKFVIAWEKVFRQTSQRVRHPLLFLSRTHHPRRK